MSPADMPDFDNMSPDEMMRWMESLAKRQGANAEELVTSADAEIAEVDASTVIDEPGYVPFGEKAPEKPKQEAPPPPEPEPEPPAPEPEPEPPAAAPPAPEPVAAAAPSGDIDYDNMSPEELMKWMESLAMRQGGNIEEMTTSADMVVGDVDASRVIDEPGYVPFGEKAPEKPKQEAPPPPPPEPEPEPPAPEPEIPDILTQLSDTEEPAAAGGSDMDWLSGLASDLGSADVPDLPDLSRLDELTADLDSALGGAGEEDTAAPAGLSWLEELASTQPAQAAPPTPEPEPEPEPAPPPPAEAAEPTGEIDYDNMSPDEMMLFLETLAKRQGVKDEELLTTADMAIAPSAEPDESDTEYESYDPDDEGDSEPAAEAAFDTQDPSDWLDQFASGGEGVPEAILDEDDTASWLTDMANQGAPPASDPQDWLADMAGGDADADADADADTEDDAEVTDDLAAWLGEAANDPAVQQHMTGFDPNPAPVTEDTPSTGDPIADMLNRGETPSAEDMEAWMSGKMDELLSSEPLPIGEDDDDAAPEADLDPDAPAEPGEIPDWLQDSIPAPDAAPAAEPTTDLGEALGIDVPDDLFTEPDASAEPDAEMPDFLSMSDDAAEEADIFGASAAEPAPLSDEITPPPDVPDMPDWLREDIPMQGDSLADIFATPEAEAEDDEPEVVTSGELDPELLERIRPQPGMEEDPWVEAIDQDQFQSVEDVPDWYQERLTDPNLIAAVDAMAGEKLTVAELPEEPDLPKGRREPLPDWLAVATGAAPQIQAEPEVEAASQDMPDWLVEEVEPDMQGEQLAQTGQLPDWLTVEGETSIRSKDIPDWLTETLEPESEPDVAPAPAASTPLAAQQPPAAAVVPATPPPASPVPANININVPETLSSARSKQQSGDIDGALLDYENVVRANAELDTVATEVEAIVKATKNNAAAHRVLGDTLMRQGKLQAALDTYRKALNLL